MCLLAWSTDGQTISSIGDPTLDQQRLKNPIGYPIGIPVGFCKVT